MQYTREQLAEILAKHNIWLEGDTSGKRADLRWADLQGANLQGANLQGAYLRDARLQNANLENITVNWDSHALTSEILWRASGDNIERQMLASFVERKTDWCWKHWLTFNHSEKEWALGVLRQWVKEGDNAPEILRYK